MAAAQPWHQRVPTYLQTALHEQHFHQNCSLPLHFHVPVMKNRLHGGALPVAHHHAHDSGQKIPQIHQKIRLPLDLHSHGRGHCLWHTATHMLLARKSTRSTRKKSASCWIHTGMGGHCLLSTTMLSRNTILRGISIMLKISKTLLRNLGSWAR